MPPAGLRIAGVEGLRMLRMVGVENFVENFQDPNLQNPGREDELCEPEPLLGGKEEGEASDDRREIQSDLKGGRQPTQTAGKAKQISAGVL